MSEAKSPNKAVYSCLLPLSTLPNTLPIHSFLTPYSPPRFPFLPSRFPSLPSPSSKQKLTQNVVTGVQSRLFEVMARYWRKV